MEKETDNTNYEYGSKPIEQRLFTTSEIAEKLGCTTSVIRNITNYYHIHSEKEIREKCIRRALYSYEAFKLIKEYRENKKNNSKTRAIVPYLERTEQEVAVIEDHSLVTDKRCLDLNWWPETVPSVFQDNED